MIQIADLNEDDIVKVCSQLTRAKTKVVVLDRVDSTNTWLAKQQPGVGWDMMICAAEHQTAGRGRRGRQWHSPYRGVTFSLAIQVPQPASLISGLSLVVGAVVCDELRALGIADAMVKWPNDILVNDRKIAGILIEVVGAVPNSCQIIVGIGVNFRRGEEAVQIEQASTDLFEQLNGATHALPNRAKLIARICGSLYEQLSCFDEKTLPTLRETWGEYDALVQRSVVVSGRGETICGTVTGIDNIGQLLVATPGAGLAGVHAIANGEVSVRTK